MDGEAGITRVGDGPVQGVEQAEPAVGLTQQESAGVGGEAAGGEVGLDPARPQAGEGQRPFDTLCHGGGPLVGVVVVW